MRAMPVVGGMMNESVPGVRVTWGVEVIVRRGVPMMRSLIWVPKGHCVGMSTCCCVQVVRNWSSFVWTRWMKSCVGCATSSTGVTGFGVGGGGTAGVGGGLWGEWRGEGVWFVCSGIKGEVSCSEEGGVVGGDIEHSEGACGEFPSVDQTVERVEGHDVEGCCVGGSGEGVCRGDGVSPVGVGCIGGDGDFFGSGVQHSCAEHRS